MASLTYNTGFEHGVSPPGTSGAGLFSVVTGSPTIQSAVKRTGNYALRCYADTAAQTYVGKALTNSDYGVIRFYFRLAAWPSASVRIFLAHNAAASNRVAAIIHTDHKLYFGRQAPGDAQLYDMTLALDTWYRIDMRVYYNATTYVLDAQVDGDPVTQYTLGSMTATSFSAPYAGLLDTATGDIYYDDMAVSQTSGDYPLGAGQGKGISPNAAGTSSPNPATKIYDNASVLVNDSSNPANIELDDVPISIDTDYIKQTTIGTSDYVEVNFADLSDAATVNGARALLAYMSSGTSSNDGKSYIIDEDAVSTTLFSGDMSESSMFYKSVQLPVTAGGWDQAAVNALKARIGYSSDITPVPYWENLMIEVDYVVQAGNTYYEAPANAFSSTPVCTPSTFLAMSPSLAAFVSTPTLAPVVIADLVGGVGLTSVPAMTPAAVADFLASITLASTPAQVSAAIADFYLSLTLASNPALSAIGGSDFYNSVAFSSGPALSNAAYKDAWASLTLLSGPALAVVNSADLLASIVLLSNPALSPLAALDIALAVTVLSNPAFSTSAGSVFYEALTFLSNPALSSAAFKEAFPTLSLLSDPALSSTALADLLAAITTVSSPAFSASGGFNFLEALTLLSGGQFSTINELVRSVLAIGAKRAASGLSRSAFEATRREAPEATRRKSS